MTHKNLQEEKKSVANKRLQEKFADSREGETKENSFFKERFLESTSSLFGIFSAIFFFLSRLLALSK